MGMTPAQWVKHHTPTEAQQEFNKALLAAWKAGYLRAVEDLKEEGGNG